MASSYDLFLEALRWGGDIGEHLHVLWKYASVVNHVTELGTSRGASTSALLLAKPQSLITYDIERHPRVDALAQAAAEQGTRFEFRQENSVETEIEFTDLLYIDTWHCYDQMKEELRRHAHKVSRYLIMHDTETFALEGERSAVGIWPAISEYMRRHPEWTLLQHFVHNNGLSVYGRAGY